MSAQVSGPAEPESTQVLFRRYVNEGRLEDLLDLYEQNGAILQKDGRVVHGADGIREHLSNLLLLKPTFHSKVVRKILVEGIAMLFSEWELSGTSPSGQPITAEGRSFDFVRQQPDGAWRIALDNPHGVMP